MRPQVVLAMGVAFGLLLPGTAAADSVTISGGELTSTGVAGNPQFTLTGAGFSVTGGADPGFTGPSLSCLPCLTGDPVNFRSMFAGDQTLGSGPALVDGVSYDRLFYAGVLDFVGGTVPLPAGNSVVTLTSPFELGADSFIEGYLTSSRLDPLFRFSLAGSGLATALFTEGPEGFFNFNQVTYAFSAAPAPIPEPGSVLLIGTGLLGVGLRRWRSRRR